ncbi:unnamed protein product [Arctia plantaginis]|uniref:Vitellogenin domain-containing protein n=1 Tax=Arctia plantaginis TaxID=874455 RepID=A0A8S0ZEL4_ARCPL|nr:unnamed protein product [Arctia plantaginis]
MLLTVKERPIRKVPEVTWLARIHSLIVACAYYLLVKHVTSVSAVSRIMSGQYLFVWFVGVCCWLTAAVPRGDHGELKLFAPVSYDVETTVLLNDVTRKDKEVGYKIKAILDLAPVWSNQQTEFFLKFDLRSPKLYLRGKHVNADFMPYDSVWDSYKDSTFYAHWKNGEVSSIYVDPEELLDVVNYKKSLASLLQFQILDGEYNETDVSGPCVALYETISDSVFRKIKRSCIEDIDSTVIEARRITRYTLNPKLNGVDALYADELVTLGDPTLGIKARAWTRLERRVESPNLPSRANTLSIALQALPAALKPLPLTLASAGSDAGDVLSDEELFASLEKIGQSDIPEAGSREAEEAAEAVLRVLPTLRAATAQRLGVLLEHPDVHSHLSVLCRLLGLAGTRAAYTAVSEFVQISGEDPIQHLSAEYLGAFSLALDPDESVVLDVLRLGEEARSEPVADSALLAAAAAAYRASSAGASTLSQAVRDALARSLARCKDDQCRTVRLQAVGNLHREDTADLLLEHALRGVSGAAGAGDAALAAVDALSVAPERALTFSRLDRLTELALDERAPLELRAAALDLVVQNRAHLPVPLARVARVLYERGPHELRRVLWQRMAALMPEHEDLRRLPSMLKPVLRGWDAQAHSGTSSVLVRETGWEGAGWRGVLESVQVARGGLLRRGVTSLRARDSRGHSVDALTVRVFTRGLEAFGGGDAETSPEGEDAPPAEGAVGGLALSVGGARMRDVTLFNGQAELLGHVWAGTASTPTAVLRALLPLTALASASPLHAGVRLRTRHSAALQLALDASAHVSLWYRTARGELALRAAAAAYTSATLQTAWGSVTANATTTVAPRLRIGADLDFYSTVALCVRTRTDEHVRRRRVMLASHQGVRRHTVRRTRTEERRVAGRTLALGRPNDDTCRTLRSGDDDDAGAGA